MPEYLTPRDENLFKAREHGFDVDESASDEELEKMAQQGMALKEDVAALKDILKGLKKFGIKAELPKYWLASETENAIEAYGPILEDVENLDYVFSEMIEGEQITRRPPKAVVNLIQKLTALYCVENPSPRDYLNGFSYIATTGCAMYAALFPKNQIEPTILIWEEREITDVEKMQYEQEWVKIKNRVQSWLVRKNIEMGLGLTQL